MSPELKPPITAKTEGQLFGPHQAWARVPGALSTRAGTVTGSFVGTASKRTKPGEHPQASSWRGWARPSPTLWEREKEKPEPQLGTAQCGLSLWGQPPSMGTLHSRFPFTVQPWDRGKNEKTHNCPSTQLFSRMWYCPQGDDKAADLRPWAVHSTQAPHSTGQVLTSLAWSASVQSILRFAGEDFPVYGLHVADFQFQPGFFHCSTPSWVFFPTAWMAHTSYNCYLRGLGAQTGSQRLTWLWAQRRHQVDVCWLIGCGHQVMLCRSKPKRFIFVLYCLLSFFVLMSKSWLGCFLGWIIAFFANTF